MSHSKHASRSHTAEDNSKETIYNQDLFLHRLKNANLNYNSTVLSSFELYYILKSVQRVRKKQKDEAKWKSFRHEQEALLNLTNNFIKKNYNLYSESLDPKADAVLLNMVSENNNCSLPIPVLNYILKSVKRKRKNLQDEERWQCFRQNLYEPEIKANDSFMRAEREFPNPLAQNAHSVDNASSKHLSGSESNTYITKPLDVQSINEDEECGHDTINSGCSSVEGFEKSPTSSWKDPQAKLPIHKMGVAQKENSYPPKDVTVAASPDGLEKLNSHVMNKNTEHSVADIKQDEPPESMSTVIAKRIQEVPGVVDELKRIEEIRIKIMSILLNIKMSISKNLDVTYSLSGEDLERIQLRTHEFVARFSRNYCYRTKCQLDELKVLDPNPLLAKKKSKILVVVQKLCAAHQGILQALQVIEKQLQVISIFGLTQEKFFSFFNFIYELTFMLKPYYGYIRSKVLDDVEKLVIETTKLLRELKRGQEILNMKKTSKPKEKKSKVNVKHKKGSKKSQKEPIWARKSPYTNKVVKKQSKTPTPEIEEKTIEEHKEVKALNFMMNIKQRPRAEVRQQNINVIEEPKTMVEIIAENELDKISSCNESTKATEMTPLQDEDQPPIKLEQQEKTVPKNVKLITLMRLESDEDNVQKVDTREFPKGHNKIWDDLTKCREEFLKYKKSNPLYNRKSLLTIKSMTDKLMDEALSQSLKKILNKINIQDLTALKIIIEEEMKR